LAKLGTILALGAFLPVTPTCAAQQRPPAPVTAADFQEIESLIQRCATGEVKEVIMALNPTIEGDTTIFYISKKLQSLPVKITSIARGVSFGGELEYVDDITLARSIVTRMPYENYFVKQDE